MTELRILAPVVVDFYAEPGAALREPVAHAQFWVERQPEVDELLRQLNPARGAADGADGSSEGDGNVPVAPAAAPPPRVCWTSIMRCSSGSRRRRGWCWSTPGHAAR